MLNAVGDTARSEYVETDRVGDVAADAGAEVPGAGLVIAEPRAEFGCTAAQSELDGCLRLSGAVARVLRSIEQGA